MEEKVHFHSDSLALEGLLSRAGGPKGAVVTHPHPLYGGDMHSNVVEAVAAAYGRAGFTTLRFNFRGVGRSEGAHDNGEGEQEDVKSALRFLAEEGASTLHLAGYSFGTWVNARVLQGPVDVEAVVMVAPPVDFMDFSFMREDPRVRLVVTGERDDIAGAAQVRRLAPLWNPKVSLHIIPGADHFYWNQLRALRSILDGFLADEG